MAAFGWSSRTDLTITIDQLFQKKKNYIKLKILQEIISW